MERCFAAVQTHRHMRRAERQHHRVLGSGAWRASACAASPGRRRLRDVPALGQHQQHGGADRRPAPISGIRRDEVETERAGVLARGPPTSKRRDRLPPPCFSLASAASISDRLCRAYHNTQLCGVWGVDARIKCHPSANARMDELER